MNILLIVAAIVLIANIVLGYKKGMVHQLVSLVSTIVGGIVVLLISIGLRKYVNGEFLNVLLVLVLLATLAIIQVAMKAFFFSLKLVSKFPVIHMVDRLVGIVFGVVETVILLWILYTIVMMFDLGMVGELIKTYISDSEILTWLYQRNYVGFLIEKYLPQSAIDFLSD